MDLIDPGCALVRPLPLPAWGTRAGAQTWSYLQVHPLRKLRSTILVALHPARRRPLSPNGAGQGE